MTRTWLLLLLLIVSVSSTGLILVPHPALAQEDTGAYRITDYRVSLNPSPDGGVQIRYEQEWLVTGGHIPWVTVGLANSAFQVKSFGGSARSVRPANYGGWSGVRVELDKDYRQNETFRFYLVVDQRSLLERLPAEGKWRIAFTPGWYDRAVIDSLRITLTSPATMDSFSFAPAPSATEGQEITWEKKNLGRGERFTVRIESTDSSFLAPAPQVDKEQEKAKQTPRDRPGGSGGSGTGDFLILAAILLSVGVSFYVLIRHFSRPRPGRRGGRSGRGGRGPGGRGYSAPEIFFPWIGGRGSSPGGDDTGGGGGFGGRSVSCACACVSCACACACACAGGGGAGCARKMHLCKLCRLRKE